MKRKGKEKQGNQLNLSRQLVMHQISCLLQLHNCISFFLDLGFKSAYKYWNYKLKEMVYVMHDLFLRIILTEKSWLKCRHFSVLFYWHFAGPFSKRPVQRLWRYCALLYASYYCQFLEVHLVLSSLLAVAVLKDLAPACFTDHFHRIYSTCFLLL